MRISEGSYRQYQFSHGVGYYHKLCLDAPLVRRYVAPPPARRETPAPAADYEAMFRRWQAKTPVEAIDALGYELGVSRQALQRLDAAYCREKQAWAFPMHDDRRTILGVRLRYPNGEKRAITGSHAGAFLPRGLESKPLLMICEGPTDTAAALMIGFNAIGRPSCSGATNIISDILQNGRRREVVIMADADGPGLVGAKMLADRILGLCAAPPRVITPTPHKDLRDWVRAGATYDTVMLRIEATERRN